MTHDVLRRLVSIGTTIALGVSGLLAPRPVEATPPCPHLMLCCAVSHDAACMFSRVQRGNQDARDVRDRRETHDSG